MTITLNLPEDTVANLNERAQLEGRPVAELAIEAVVDRYGPYDKENLLGEDTFEKLERGLKEINAGKTMSLAEARADLKAAFSQRYRNGSA